MGESKKGNTAKTEKTGYDSLLVALTVTSIAAAAVIGFSAGQMKIAHVAIDQIRMLASSPSEREDTSVEGTISLPVEAYDSLVKVCNSIDSSDAEAEADVDSEADAETAE